MIKKLLIISPHFPPVNAPDMHRVRQSLPSLEKFGWRPVLFTVEPGDVEGAKDPLLVKTLPEGTEIYRVRALPASWTRKIGLGNLGIRSYLQLRKAVDRYLSENRVELIYFSTTVFVSMALGPHWKRKFGVPFVIDLQDPWRNDYHLSTPPRERPKKFWFDYRLNKFLESRTIPEASGIISVSPAYPEEIKRRYPSTATMPMLTLPFSALPVDFQVAEQLNPRNHLFTPQPGHINVINLGAIAPNMIRSIDALFAAVRKGVDRDAPLFSRFRFFFVGTSYAYPHKGARIVEDLAGQHGIGHLVCEQTAREPYFSSLKLLLDADLLLLPGSLDNGYTSSRLYPYILSKKPILAICNEQSSVVNILQATRAGEVATFRPDEEPHLLANRLLPMLVRFLAKLPYLPATDWTAFAPYSADNMVRRQCAFFDSVLPVKKRVLIISPHFPPVNAADMHRVRQSLPYLKEFGWEPVLFTVEPGCVEGAKDDLLLETLPAGTEIHRVKALSASLTRTVGVGNLGIRSFPYLRREVDRYLRKNRVDLIYFSTTVFVSVALGPHWKQKFGVPFVIDLQDPWRNDFHLSTPRRKRPKKFWFDYRLNKMLEARTLPECSGVIAVSSGYVRMMKERYPSTQNTPCLTLPFGALPHDFRIAAALPALRTNHDTIDVVYIGRGGSDMAKAVKILFTAFARGLQSNPQLFSPVRFTFIGTSYASEGKGIKTIQPLAEQMGIGSYVTESTDRLPYFQSLKRLQEADLLFMPGSTDPSYTASKLYPYIMAKKAILALFNEQSSVVDILAKTRAGEVVTFRNDEKITHVGIRLQPVLTALLEKLPFQPATDWEAFEPFTAREMTRQQCDFFDKVVEKSGFQVLPPPDPPRDTEESPEPPGRRSPS